MPGWLLIVQNTIGSTPGCCTALHSWQPRYTGGYATQIELSSTGAAEGKQKHPSLPSPWEPSCAARRELQVRGAAGRMSATCSPTGSCQRETLAAKSFYCWLSNGNGGVPLLTMKGRLLRINSPAGAQSGLACY